MRALHKLTAVLLSALVPTQSSIAQAPSQHSEVVVMPTGEAILRWQAKQGRTYFIQGSDPNDHLGTWIWSDYIEHGHDHEISHEVGNTADKAFFRLHYTDAPPPAGVSLEDWDADGDSLSNALELSLQGNPLKTDTDVDDIPDGWAYAHGLSISGNNASGLFQGGPSTNLQAYQQGVQANPASTINDHDGDGVENDYDADQQDSDVDWEPASVNGYALIDIEVPEEAGLIRDLNDAGHVLFDGGVWKAGTWTPLEQVEMEGEFHLDPYDFSYQSLSNLGWKLSPAGDILELGIFSVSGPGDSEEMRHVLRRAYQPQNQDYQSAVTTLQTLDWYGLSGYSYLSLQVLGEDSQGRVFVYKKFDPTLPEDSAPGIWILDGNLEHTSSYELPVAYHIQLHGNQVTPSGWLAVNASPNTGNTPAARTIVWNSTGQEISTPGGLPLYFTGLTELPHDKPALAFHNNGSNSLVYLLDESGGAFKPASKLVGKNIHTFAGDGTAMTSDGKMWINGKLTPIRDICPQYGKLIDDGWSFQIHKANKQGIYLVEAHKNEESSPYLLVPVDYSVFPPEPTAEELEAAGDNNWEIETFQIAADEPEFWIQANVMAPGFDENGESVMKPVEDGSVITWEIVTDDSDAGATLSQETSETEDGHSSVKLSTTTNSGHRFKVRGKLTTLKMDVEGTEDSVTYENPDGFCEVKTQLFEVVPGNVTSILASASESSVPADGATESVIQAVITDYAGNPAARGTDVNWRIKGGGRIKECEHLVAGQDGTVKATVVAGDMVGSQSITIEADGVVTEIPITNTPVQITGLSAADATLDLTNNETTILTLQTSGLADGAEVTWLTSKGMLIETGSTIQGNTATATLLADSGTLGTASVIATVGNTSTRCDVTFESSATASVEVANPVLAIGESAGGSENLPTLDGGTTAVPYHATTTVTIRAPAHPGAWATVGFAGSSRIQGPAFSFDAAVGGVSLSNTQGIAAALVGGASIADEWELVRNGVGSLHLPSPVASATIPHDTSLNLLDGSVLRFSLHPVETTGTVFTKASACLAAFQPDGKLVFTLGEGATASTVVSTSPLPPQQWSDIEIHIESGRLHMGVGNSASSAILTAPPPVSSSDWIIGGFAGHLDNFHFTHRQNGLQGIVIHSIGLDAQNRVMLDSNGEAVITVSAPIVGNGPPESVLAQHVDMQVDVAGQTTTAKEVVTVTDKGTAVLIRAIAGQTAIIGTNTQNLDRAEMAKNFLRRGVKNADRAGALPTDLSADAAARGECGYLIAIWMEETVDEAGIVRPLMSVTAQNLPEEVAEVLNWMLAEMMLSAGQRSDSESFADYILRNHKELLLALESLSAGNIPQFLALAEVLDGGQGFANGSAVAEQVGNGVIQAIAKSGIESAGEGYDNLRALFNNQNWGVVMRERQDGVAALRRLQKSVIDSVAGTAANSKEVIKNCSEYLLAEEIIDSEGAAALGFAYGVVEALDQLGQDVAQPELLAQTAMQLADLTISAVGGDVQAKEALKEIGSLAAIAPINTIDESAGEWQQGNYFQAGANAVAVVEVALVAKFVKDLAVKSTRKALLWGRHRTTDWQATYAHIGKTAETLAFKRLRSKGFKDIVPIRNDSNHGIDWVCRDKNGGVVFIEVKGHRLDARPVLRGDQLYMKTFTESRLQQAVLGQGHWANVSEEVASNARKILNEIRRPGSTVHGYVVNVDYAVSKLPKVRYYEWLNGVGDLANPRP